MGGETRDIVSHQIRATVKIKVWWDGVSLSSLSGEMTKGLRLPQGLRTFYNQSFVRSRLRNRGALERLSCVVSPV